MPGFGDPDARLLLVGLAPAAHGANRTGRVFTGDGSGDFLAARAARHRLRQHRHLAQRRRRPDPARRVHPGRRALRAARQQADARTRSRAAGRHLAAEIAALPRVRVVVALGKIGHDAYLAHLAETHGVRPRPRPAFGHGSEARLGPGLPVLLGSYHPSRQNTNTGKLTPPMMRSVFMRARSLIDVDGA